MSRKYRRPFWKRVEWDDPIASLEKGSFWDVRGEEPSGFVDVNLKLKDINALVAKQKRLSASPTVEEKKDRARRAEWEDWVAALATLAHEHSIDGGVTRDDLLCLITARLQGWGFRRATGNNSRANSREGLGPL